MKRQTLTIRWLTVLVCLLALPFLTWIPAVLVRLAIGINPNPKGVLNTLLLCLYAPIFLSSLLLSHMARYLLSSVAALVLALIALELLVARERSQVFRRARFYLLIACAMSILAFPLAFRYHPAVEAAPGVEMHIVNQPGLLEGVVRSCQAHAEVYTEVYVPVGWADDHTLVYQVYTCDPGPLRLACGHFLDWAGGDVPLWAYDVETGRRVPYTAGERSLTQDTCGFHDCIKPRLDTQWFFSGRSGSSDGLVSPGGRWIAFTARHVYGPEDLLVISSAKS